MHYVWTYFCKCTFSIIIYLSLAENFTYHFFLFLDGPFSLTLALFWTEFSKLARVKGKKLHTTVRIRKYEVVYYNNIYNHYASRRRVSSSRKTVMQVTITQFRWRKLSQLNCIADFSQKGKDKFIYIDRRLNNYRLHIPIYIYILLINSTAVFKCRITHVYCVSPVRGVPVCILFCFFFPQYVSLRIFRIYVVFSLSFSFFFFSPTMLRVISYVSFLRCRTADIYRMFLKSNVGN